MTTVGHRCGKVEAWYERVGSPGMALAALVFLQYGSFLFAGFMIDDHRCMRHCREFRDGARESLEIYEFLLGGEANPAARRGGWYPWWITDDLRYRHLRPAAEQFLYCEYLIFGEWASGYHLVGLLLYALGVRLVLALFRFVGNDERLARWAALIFAVSAGHAIPVVFISAQCDTLALVLAVGAILSAGRYVRDGGLWRLVPALLLYGAGLLSKEAVLPTAVLPPVFWFFLRGKPGVPRRVVVVTALMVLVGMVWLGFYARGGYGANTMLMLDPLRAPAEYLAALPGRAIILLSSWVIPATPFLFWFQHGLWVGVYVYGLLGSVILLVLFRMYRRHHRHQRGVITMALWVLPFLPLLVCTIPDDRVMVLPSAGLAFLGAAWMTRRAGPSTAPDILRGAGGLRRLPFMLFIVLNAGSAGVTSGIMWFMEDAARRNVESVVRGFEREIREGDCVFFLNNSWSIEGLFAQDRLDRIVGAGRMKIAMLSDIIRPTVRVVDAHTIRLETDDPPFFSSFVGLMGTSKGRKRQVGDSADVGEYQVKIVEAENGQVRVIEFHFRRPIKSESYRFYWNRPFGRPVPYDFTNKDTVAAEPSRTTRPIACASG